LDDVVIIGHGPSIHSGLGAVIDTMTVVRLKRGLLDSHDRRHWGSRTDYLCACSNRFDNRMFPFWLVRNEEGKKETTGLLAVREAHARGYRSIWVIGFDKLLRPWEPDPPNTWLAHDKFAEHEALMALGVKELG
jgi:hypothetical protein